MGYIIGQPFFTMLDEGRAGTKKNIFFSKSNPERQVEFSIKMKIHWQETIWKLAKETAVDWSPWLLQINCSELWKQNEITGKYSNMYVWRETEFEIMRMVGLCVNICVYF